MLEKTFIHNFATGITCAAGGTLAMNQSAISNCGTGLEAEDTSNIRIGASQMSNNSDFAIFLKIKAENILESGEKRKVMAKFDELRNIIP